MEVCIVQDLFCSIKGGFFFIFDFLREILMIDSFVVVKVIGDFDDFNFIGEIVYDIIFFFVIDFI